MILVYIMVGCSLAIISFVFGVIVGMILLQDQYEKYMFGRKE